MKRIIYALLALSLLLCACAETAVPPEGTAARVGEEYIYTEAIENDRLIGVAGSDREIVEGKVLNMLMCLEAEKLGLAATQEDIDEFMVSQETAWKMAGMREQIESMYAPLGISFEEYKEMLAELAPNTIARQKLRDYYGREYCEKNCIEFTKVNPSAEMTDYVDGQLQKLWSKYKGEYDIYID